MRATDSGGGALPKCRHGSRAPYPAWLAHRSIAGKKVGLHRAIHARAALSRLSEPTVRSSFLHTGGPLGRLFRRKLAELSGAHTVFPERERTDTDTGHHLKQA